MHINIFTSIPLWCISLRLKCGVFCWTWKIEILESSRKSLIRCSRGKFKLCGAYTAQHVSGSLFASPTSKSHSSIETRAISPSSNNKKQNSSQQKVLEERRHKSDVNNAFFCFSTLSPKFVDKSIILPVFKCLWNFYDICIKFVDVVVVPLSPLFLIPDKQIKENIENLTTSRFSLSGAAFLWDKTVKCVCGIAQQIFNSTPGTFIGFDIFNFSFLSQCWVNVCFHFWGFQSLLRHIFLRLISFFS